MKRTLALAALAGIIGWHVNRRAGEPALAAAPVSRTVLIRFGLDGRAGVDWSGSVSAPGARLSGWQFSTGDRVEGLSWTCSTKEETYWDTPYEPAMKGTSHRDKLTQRGILLVLPETGAPVKVTTRQGEFSFDPAPAPGDPPRRLLDGRVSVEGVPAASRLSEDGRWDDYPSLIEARDGSLWLAWVSYDGKGDQVWARSLRNGAWSKPEPLASPGGDYFRTAIAQDRAGRIWVVWSAQSQGNFDLWARAFDGRKWSPAERLTSAENSDIFHVLAADASGNLHLAWQSARAGNFDIYLRTHDGKRWSDEMQVSSSPADDWEPALAAAPDGRMTVVWDTYDRGNYDVVSRTRANGRFGPVVPIAATAAFEARASAAYDRKGRLWAAYDEGDANWGKDYGNLTDGPGRGLMVRRQARIAVVENGRVLDAPPPVDALPEDFRQAAQHPTLLLDRQDRPWLFYRVRVNLPVGGAGEGKGYRGSWRLYGTAWGEGGWSPAFEFEGYGRIDMAAAAAVHRGGVAAVWASDGRGWTNSKPSRGDLYFASWPAPSAGGAPPLAPRAAAPADPPPVHAAEAADVARVRGWRVQSGGRSLRIVRGDLHRHTDLSWDGNRDGSLDDSYRYALDAVAFDFLGVCDHQAGESIPYHWWRIQKAVDLFTIRGRFAPLYSYERSLPWPNGHRNVFFAERGRPILEIAPGELKGKEGAGNLYAYLRGFAGLTSSHTSATGAGTDFRDNDRELEPVVEIYQGYRNNFEGPGTPRSASRKEAEKFAAGFVWKAWEKGLRLGVQSSSDHVSTHMSYAAFYVEEVERKSILAAMKARRTYAATDNLIVEMRTGDRFMGGEFEAAVPPPFAVTVIGTAPLASVEVIRNNQVVYSVKGTGQEARFNWTDREPPAGTSWYYVRALQEDGQLAWGSPVWFRKL